VRPGLPRGRAAEREAAAQVRGSIPLLWSQVPNIKYKPTTAVAPPAAYEPVFDRHARDLLAAYQARRASGPSWRPRRSPRAARGGVRACRAVNSNLTPPRRRA
jgi:hypothetical protein